MTWSVKFSNQAKKQLAAIDKRQRLFIEHWLIENLEGCENPRAVHGSKQIKGHPNGWRYRVGSYRILCELLDGELVIKVIRVGHRQGVYRNLN